MAIKIKRAAKLCPVSQYPRTWEAVVAAIPESVKQACTSAQIAELATAMRAQYDAGHTAGYNDAA